MMTKLAYAKIVTIGLIHSGHWFNLDDTVIIDLDNPEHGLYYPARRVTDDALQHLKREDFEVFAVKENGQWVALSS